jgi:ribosomal protein S12 methylthiotransferase accessory factor
MLKEIEVSFPVGKRIDARIGDFIVHTDQSSENGGEETAPEPFQLFLASIATCAGIYALEFCRARELSSEGMALTMSYEWDEKKHAIERMHIELKLPPGFPDQYKTAVVRAMDLCTAKKHIIHPPEFVLTAN